MASFEDTAQKAIADGVLQGLVVFAQDIGGSVSYSKAFGKTSLNSNASDMKLNTPMQIASMTKLLTTVAVLQLVDRGLIGLDDDVEPHIPEFVQQGVLEDVDESGKPLTRPIKNKVTLRLLLTHSAGSIYDMFDPRVEKIKRARGVPPGGGGTLEARALFPMVFEPGTSWRYGMSIDWAGRVLERVTGGTLDAWMKQNMWPQLGIKNVSFFPFMATSATDLPQVTMRNEKGELVPAPAFINKGTSDSFGGHGAVASMDEYIKVLHSLLVNDEKLLKKATVDQMFQPQLTPGAKSALQEVIPTPIGALFVGDFPEPEQYDWGLGGILVEKDNDGRRKKGTLIWSGMANCYWFIDRKAGLCGVFGAQVLPPGDPKVEEVIKSFEFAMYRKLSARL